MIDWINLHHHKVLVEPGVHGGDFALAEGIVEHLSMAAMEMPSARRCLDR